MLPLQYEAQVREYQRVDLLSEAAELRVLKHAHRGGARRLVRQTALEVVCRLPLPVLGPACAGQPG